MSQQSNQKVSETQPQQLEFQAPTHRGLIENKSLRQLEEQVQIQGYRNYGSMIILKTDQQGNPIYMLGPHSYLTIITIIVSGLCCFYIFYHLFDKTNKWFMFGSITSTIFYLYCFVKVGLSSPGLASSKYEPSISQKIADRYCIPCRIVREPGTKHCYYCDVCIYKYDHHCPWVGKCIGRDNIKMFYIFLVSVSLMMSFLVLSTVTATKKIV